MALTYTERKVALVAIKSLRARNAAYWEERDAMRRLPVGRREFDWQSYCIHGSYIGDPYGADYLCGLCEGGVTIYDEALAWAHAADQQMHVILGMIGSLQLAERMGAIPSAHRALNAAFDTWTQRYLTEAL